YLPIFYGTVNVWTFLGDPATAWISVAVNQTCTTEDFLLFGELIGNAIAGLDRRVVLLASGGMTHLFFRFRELRQHDASDPIRNLFSPEAWAADRHELDMLQTGAYAGETDGMLMY